MREYYSSYQEAAMNQDWTSNLLVMSWVLYHKATRAGYKAAMYVSLFDVQ